MTDPLPLVLAAEDEETDALILQRAFQKASISNRLVIVRDGEEAIDYLAAAGPYRDRAAYPLPGLVLLDLKMPRKTGFDVLEWMGTRPELSAVPVVVLSSSSAGADIRRAREMGARDFLVKPTDLTQYVSLVGGLRTKWLSPDGHLDGRRA